jgi:hypothetical protein
VTAHAQKPGFIFWRNRQVYLNRQGGVISVDYWQPRCARISGSNAGYTMFRGSVKSTRYPLHLPVSPFTSPPVRHRVPSRFNCTLPTMCQYSTGWPRSHRTPTNTNVCFSQFSSVTLRGGALLNCSRNAAITWDMVCPVCCLSCTHTLATKRSSLCQPLGKHN